jgi:hypothetical protein
MDASKIDLSNEEGFIFIIKNNGIPKLNIFLTVENSLPQQFLRKSHPLGHKKIQN